MLKHKVKKQGNTLLISPQRKVVPPLEELIKKITPLNLHPETCWGAPRGNEFW
jgi:antitoxin component of MazEF toxin-antitoxin module